MNPVLYSRAMFFVNLPYPKVRLTGTTADGYFYQLLEDTEADIIINIDEDAFVFDINRLKSLIDYVIQNDYVNCGMPDGGVVHLRRMNPLVTNAYFNILNVREIRKLFSVKAVQEFPFYKDNYMDNFPKDLLRGEYKFVNYESYYPFFIWLSQHFKTLYLDAENHPDGESTTLYNHLHEPFLIHTWYSRMYNHDRLHTKRINNVIRECEMHSGRNYPTSFGEIIISYAAQCKGTIGYFKKTVIRLFKKK
jgi:hypothetical protein